MSKEPSIDLIFTFLEEAKTAFIALDASLNLIYANPASEQLLSQSKQRLYQLNLKTLEEQFHFSTDSIEKLLLDKSSFTENEVTFFVDGHPLLINLSASYLELKTEEYVLIEMRGIDQQKRISQVHHQETNKKLRKNLCVD